MSEDAGPTASVPASVPGMVINIDLHLAHRAEPEHMWDKVASTPRVPCFCFCVPFSAPTVFESSAVPWKALRERLEAKAIDSLWWFDTRDMVCDAMTKGNISRDALLKLWRIARLELTGDTPVVWRLTANTDGSKEPTVEETEITRSLFRFKIRRH